MADLDRIRPVLPHRVYRRDQWRDDWELVPFLFCNGCTLSFAPEIPQAELEYQYGRIYWPDTGAFDEYPQLDLLGDFVRIVIESPEGQILWIGQVVDEIRNLRGGDVRQLPTGELRRGSGVQTFIALGLDHALRRTIVDRAFYMDELANLTNTIEIHRALVFNEENEHGGAGNRSRTQGNEGVYLFTDDLAQGRAWSSRDVLRYLLKFFTPRDVNGELEIPFEFDTTVNQFVPNFDQPRLRPQNRNLFELLSSLIDRRRLLSWRIVYDAEERPYIAAVPFNHQDVTTPGGNLYPANPATVQLDFDNSIDVMRSVLRRSLANSFHEVVVRGERIRSCFTCAHGYNSLVADWKLDDQTAYNAGPSGLGGLDRSQRERRVNNFRREDRFRRVYAAFRLPDDFNGFTDNDSINPPDLDFEQLDFYRPGLRLLRHTLIRDLQSEDGAHPFLPMAAYLRLPSESPERFVQLDQLGGLAGVESAEAKEGVDFSASVAPIPDDAGVLLRITGAPQHVIASAEFVPLTTIAEKPAIFNWQTSLFITVAMELDGYCEGRYAQNIPADIDMVRTLVIDLGDRLRLDWIAPDTIVRLNDGQLVTSAGEYVRDDRPLAKDLARIAFDYHAVERQALSIAWRQVREITTIGSLITFIGGGAPGQTLEPVHALVTGVAFDLVRGATTVTTDFAELDLVALL